MGILGKEYMGILCTIFVPVLKFYFKTGKLNVQNKKLKISNTEEST